MYITEVINFSFLHLKPICVGNTQTQHLFEPFDVMNDLDLTHCEDMYIHTKSSTPNEKMLYERWERFNRLRACVGIVFEKYNF